MVLEPATTLDPSEWANMIVLQDYMAVHNLSGSFVELKLDECDPSLFSERSNSFQRGLQKYKIFSE